MRATEQSEEEMAKAIGYIVMELENTGCAITAEAINARLELRKECGKAFAEMAAKKPYQIRFNESLCG
ncbi:MULTISPECIES: hypothetical protein [Enterobacteriaceae]|jgi:hypothetical protein|uniref:Uncharacterized protein n=1 Tax=Kluyvera intermedia TaxID=61648 RepID=A0ABX3UK08_KLUIN|nr:MULTISPECIES: hypothetical protein [Enterobacteriaceae]MCL9672237.1 hypothetical protein [Citrobacter sp. MNAZ 1397]MDU6683700.1 hypothetical protein [Enterobacteriaceae bacterium]ORJ51180.1 hypothetical protein B2M27_06970 [Kluyvera intermedia]HAU8267631.1 hypothetical protein [Kluyvera intermedia]